MAYIALKASRFDRKYVIGQLIPDGVVDPRAAASLVAMGRIVRDVKAVNIFAAQFLGPITGEDEDDFDYPAFREQYNAAMGNFTGDAASFAQLDQILAENGRITVGEAKGVFFNLPWVAVRFDLSEAVKTLTVSYTKDDAPGTFTRGNGDISDTSKDVVTGSPTIASGSHMISYVLGDGALETDASLGLKGDAANGSYAFTLTVVTANDETVKETASAVFSGGVSAVKAMNEPAEGAQKAAGAPESAGGVNTPTEAENAAVKTTAATAAKKKTAAKK